MMPVWADRLACLRPQYAHAGCLAQYRGYWGMPAWAKKISFFLKYPKFFARNHIEALLEW